MHYVELGRTGLRVSRLCLGTMNFGAGTDERTAFAIMDRALELGINFFDTADRYGPAGGRGLTEEIVGRWLAQGDRRDRIVLATKIYGPMGRGANDRGLSAYHIRRGCEASLRRLGTDHIDLYQMHHSDLGAVAPHHRADLDPVIELYDLPGSRPGTPWEEIWQAMGQLMGAGKITYVGSSNFAAWTIAKACERAFARNLLGLVSEQSVYSLARRQVELEVLPACREYGLGFLCWSPLAGGLLAGATRDVAGRRVGMSHTPEVKRQVEAWEAMCRERGDEPAELALAWLLANPLVTCPIVGPRTLEQLESAARSTRLSLSTEERARLDGIFPGPGGEAPMAYAW